MPATSHPPTGRGCSSASCPTGESRALLVNFPTATRLAAKPPGSLVHSLREPASCCRCLFNWCRMEPLFFVLFLRLFVSCWLSAALLG